MTIEWTDETLPGFIKERDAMLLSMDKQTVLDFMRKWNDPDEVAKAESLSERGFWAGVHKARAGTTSLPMSERIKSKFWLRQNGFKVDIH